MPLDEPPKTTKTSVYQYHAVWILLGPGSFVLLPRYRPRRDHRTHGISLARVCATRKKTMSALLLSVFCFVPFLLVALAFLRSTALTKYLDDPHEKRRQ